MEPLTSRLMILLEEEINDLYGRVDSFGDGSPQMRRYHKLCNFRRELEHGTLPELTQRQLYRALTGELDQ